MNSSIKNINKTLCILANSKVGDHYGKRICDLLRTKYHLSDLQLIGNGDELLQKEGMTSFVDLNDLNEKDLHLWRYHQKSILSFKYSTMHLYQHVYLRPNKNLLKLLEENDTYSNIVRARPSCILALDNEYLSHEMVLNLNKKYNYKYMENKLKKPDSYLLTNTVRHWDEHYHYAFDQAFYHLAFPQINRRFYVTPSHYIGQYGAYDAIRHLWQKSGIFNHLLREDTLFISREHSVEDIERARLIVSAEFRAKHKIEEKDTVVFFSPGNTVFENKFCLEAFRNGYKEFILQNSYPTSLSHYAAPKKAFKLIVTVQKGTKSEEYVRKYLSESPFETDVIIVSNENNEHFDAICASDFGFVHNGQMVSSAAALHLSTTTMQYMKDLNYFWHTWENRWLADINLNADRMVVKEMVGGEFWYGNIANKLSEEHTNTDKRWDQVRECKPFVLETLPYKPIDRNQYTIRDLKIDGDVVDEFEDPINIMTNKVFNSMKNYQNSWFQTPDIKNLSKPIPSLKLTNHILH